MIRDEDAFVGFGRRVRVGADGHRREGLVGGHVDHRDVVAADIHRIDTGLIGRDRDAEGPFADAHAGLGLSGTGLDEGDLIGVPVGGDDRCAVRRNRDA